MKEIFIACEGETEEAFVKNLLYYEFCLKGVILRPLRISTSPRGKGGALKRQRVFRFLRNTLREQRNTYVTTFFDLFSLPNDFPGLESISQATDPLDRAKKIERAFHNAVVREIECRPERFFPHIQPYEFEALLFSDTTGFVKAEPKWKAFAGKLSIIRESSTSPEHINNGINSHPSALLRDLLRPRYKKVMHGTRVSTEIGISRMRSECQHFNGWLKRIENLPALD